MHYLASYPGQVCRGNEAILAAPACFSPAVLGDPKAVWGQLFDGPDYNLDYKDLQHTLDIYVMYVVACLKMLFLRKMCSCCSKEVQI